MFNRNFINIFRGVDILKQNGGYNPFNRFSLTLDDFELQHLERVEQERYRDITMNREFFETVRFSDISGYECDIKFSSYKNLYDFMICAVLKYEGSFRIRRY